jgi:hypothetical protein
MAQIGFCGVLAKSICFFFQGSGLPDFLLALMDAQSYFLSMSIYPWSIAISIKPAPPHINTGALSNVGTSINGSHIAEPRDPKPTLKVVAPNTNILVEDGLAKHIFANLNASFKQYHLLLIS